MKNIKFTFLAGLLLLICLPAFPQSNYDWGLATGNRQRDEVTDLGMDAQGNVYVTGAFGDSMDMANGGVKEYLYGYGYRDIFLAKYDVTGAKQWAFSIGDIGWDRGWAMTVNDQGDVYTGGVFSRSADFDPGPDSMIFTANPAGFWPDGYLAKYNTSGELVWAKHLLTARNRSASHSATLFAVQGMDIDNNGNVIIGGAFWDSLWLAPNHLIVSDGSLSDMFLAKYDSDGNLLWGHQMGGASDQRIQSLAVDPQGDIYTTGFYFGSPDFDPAGGTVLTTQGAEDIFLAKYSSSGALLWAQGFGSVNGSNVSTESGLDVGTDGMGNVYLTGRLLGMADFDPGAPGGEITPTTSVEIYCAKFSGAGALDWVFALEGGAFKLGKQLSVFPNGDFWLACEFGASFANGGLDIDPGPDTVAISSLGSFEDVFIGQYDKDGKYQDHIELRGLGGCRIEGLAANEDHVSIGGYFNSSILLDRQSGNLKFSKGDEDIFIIQYGNGAMGLENDLAAVNFSIYPNPATQFINLKFQLHQTQNLSVSLHSMDGKRLMDFEHNKTLAPGNHQLRWALDEGLAAGRYLLAVYSEKGQQVLPVLIRR